MRYLIDTNIFLYSNYDKTLLSRDVTHIIENYENIIYMSSESVKEVIHLFQNGKIKTNWKNTNDIFNYIDECGITIKYVAKEHLLALGALEQVDGHNDPSDRLIIAQAIIEKIPLISSDRDFESYRKQQLNFIYNKK